MVQKDPSRGKINAYLLRSYGSLARPLELLKHSPVTSEIVLTANKNDRKTGTEVHHFRNPLVSGDAVRRPNGALFVADVPFPERCPKSPVSRRQSK